MLLVFKYALYLNTHAPTGLWRLKPGFFTFLQLAWHYISATGFCFPKTNIVLFAMPLNLFFPVFVLSTILWHTWKQHIFLSRVSGTFRWVCVCFWITVHVRGGSLHSHIILTVLLPVAPTPHHTTVYCWVMDWSVKHTSTHTHTRKVLMWTLKVLCCVGNTEVWMLSKTLLYSQCGDSL